MFDSSPTEAAYGSVPYGRADVGSAPPVSAVQRPGDGADGGRGAGGRAAVPEDGIVGGRDAGADGAVDPALDDVFVDVPVEVLDTFLQVPEDGPSAAELPPSGFAALELDLATRFESTLDDAGLVDAVVGFERLSAWAQARQARLLAEFARRRPGDDPAAVGCDTPSAYSRYAPDEVGMALHLSRGTAMARLGRAVRLDTTLRATLEAWESGRLDLAKVRAIDDATTVLDPADAVAVQDRVLPRAPGQSLAALCAALARAVIEIDPEGAAERHRRARRERRVSVGADSDGMASLWALLAAPDALAAHEWLTRLARGLGSDDPRGMDARRADLLVELLTGRLTIEDRDDDPDAAAAEVGVPAEPTGASAEPTEPHEPADAPAEPAGRETPQHTVRPRRPRPARPVVAPGRPLVQVVMPFSALNGTSEQPCELVGHGAIPAPLAREIAADAVWRRLVTDPLSGTLLDHGRTTYRPGAALADHLRARDQYCRRPHCRKRAATAELDHVVPFPRGSTSEPNMMCGCPHDHRLKHAPGWSVVLHRDASLTWITPTGHRYTTHPHDYRPEPGDGGRADPSPPGSSPSTPRRRPAPEPNAPPDDRSPPGCRVEHDPPPF